MPVATFNVGDPLKSVLPLKLSAPPPPPTFNVLASERLPKPTVPLELSADSAVTLTELAYVGGPRDAQRRR